MANAAIVYDGVPGTNEGEGTLFNGMKFWFSSTVPQRNHFKAQVESNGGKVMNSDKDADVLLVDHKRRNNPPGSYSYQFVEHSIRSGKLENRDEYLAGPSPGTIRPVGSTRIPAKGKRIPFTAEDDQVLYDFVKPYELNGGKVSGLEIYKQLEEQHPRHTFQSWRERYLKKVKDQPRPSGSVSTETRPTTNRAQSARASSEANQSGEAPRSTPVQTKYETFKEEERHMLLHQARDVLNLDTTKEGEAWAQFAQANPSHSAEEWRSYFNDVVLPEYREAKAKKKDAARKGKPPSSPRKRGSPIPPASETRETSAPMAEVRQRTEESQHVNLNRQLSEQTQANNKRRYSIASERWQTVRTLEDDESSRSRKRRATDYVVREIPSTPERSRSPEAHRHDHDAPRSPLFCSSASPTTRRRTSRTPVSPGKRSIQEERRRSPSISSSRNGQNEQFETAPQYRYQASEDDDDNGVSSQLLHDLNENFGDFVPPPTQKPETHGPEPTRPNPDEENEIKRLDDWMSSRLKSGKATDKIQLITALSCTSMDPALADKVLEHLVARRGIPDNMSGVWTKEDDEDLEASDGRAVQRVQEKHGFEGFNRRFEYLEMQRRAEMERQRRHS